MKKIALGCLSLLSLLATAQSDLTTKLQACYDLDCSTGIQITNGAGTGNALDGTVNGSITCVTGHLGTPSTAVQFGGTALDYIALPNNPLIKPTTSVTIAGWYYVTNTAYQTLVFAKNACASTQPAYSISSNNGWFGITKYPPSCGTGTMVNSAATTMYAWHFVVAYADNSKLRVTVDNGTPVTISHTLVFNYDPNSSVFLGGTNVQGTNFPFNGRMDNIRFYNRELTSAEIAKLYNLEPICSDEGIPPVSDFNMATSTICENESITYVNQSANSSDSWNWQFEGGTPPTSNLMVPTVNYSAAGVYTVSLQATNKYGVGTIVTKTVTVTTCLGLEGHKYQELKPQIFPNPATGRFTIDRVSDCEVSILDVSGRLIEVLRPDNNRVEVDCSKQAAGIYFVAVKNKLTGLSTVLKVVLCERS
jgi:PKD repeat protein